MKITDKRTARVELHNDTPASVSFFMIPLSAIVDRDGSRTLASDRTEQIVVPANSSASTDIPAGYRIGALSDLNQTSQFICNKLGVTGNIVLTNIGDSGDPGDIVYDITAECVRQGDIISATLTAGE